MSDADYVFRRLSLAEMDTAAQIHRIAFDDRLPWLAGLHTPEQDRWFFRERVYPACEVWGAFEGTTMHAFIAFREDWIEHLYVLPQSQGHGAGSALLEVARSAFPHLYLWTFQRNVGARGFYASRGFVAVRETDGARNDEHEPDVLYEWRAASPLS
jgi:GNAT superfamily N-acetyltransferase